MKERFKFLLYYFIFWVVFFIAAKIIFLSYHILDTQKLTVETVWGIFYHGFKMDISFSAYLAILPFLLVTFSNFIKKSVFEGILFTYTFVMVFLMTFLIVSDLEVYNVWGYRIDATPIAYLNSPREAFASVMSTPIIQLTISFILLVLLANYLVYRVISSQIHAWKFVKPFPFVLYSFIISCFLILPIRGSLGTSPMNQSKVFFSKINFANLAAINPGWNFFQSLLRKSYSKTNPYIYYPKNEINKALEELFSAKSNDNIKYLKETNPNVLIIIWESFTEKAIDLKIDSVSVTPNFNELRKEGIYFSNIYSTGDRTDKGLIGVLSAFPAQPAESIIKYPKKTGSLPSITNEFLNNNHTTEFYYGGDLGFANIKSYLYNANYDKMVSQDDFADTLEITNWGHYDHYLYEKFLQEHKEKANKPFFTTLLTLSSHEPFNTPNNTIYIKGEDVKSKFLNVLHYSDDAFGKFIEQAKKEVWWDNTLIIVLGDHGHKYPDSEFKADDFRIPMLWLGGALEQKGIIKNKVGSQLDLAKTLLNQMNFNSSEFNWSKDLLNKTTLPWAFFCFNDGFGLVTDEGEFVFNNVGKREIYRKGIIKETDIKNGKILQQKTFQDFLDK